MSTNNSKKDPGVKERAGASSTEAPVHLDQLSQFVLPIYYSASPFLCIISAFLEVFFGYSYHMTIKYQAKINWNVLLSYKILKNLASSFHFCVMKAGKWTRQSIDE